MTLVIDSISQPGFVFSSHHRIKKFISDVVVFLAVELYDLVGME